MISCLGPYRVYKGLDLACAAVQRLNGRVQLAVAGPAHAGFDVAGLREAIARVPGAIVIPRQLNDQEFADLWPRAMPRSCHTATSPAAACC